MSVAEQIGRALSGTRQASQEIGCPPSPRACLLLAPWGGFGGARQEESRNVKRFREGLVFKAHRLVYHSTLGWRETMKKKKRNLTPLHGLANRRAQLQLRRHAQEHIQRYIHVHMQHYIYVYTPCHARIYPVSHVYTQCRAQTNGLGSGRNLTPLDRLANSRAQLQLRRHVQRGLRAWGKGTFINSQTRPLSRRREIVRAVAHL